MSFSEADVFRALPPDGFLKKYVEYASQCTDANASYHLGTGVALLAQTAPMDLHVPFGTPIFSNTYALNVGPSSVSRKSASIGVMRDLLKEAVPSALGETPGSREALVEGLRMSPRQVILYPEFGTFLAATEKGYLTPLKTAYTEAYDSSPLSRSLVKNARGTDTTVEPRLSLVGGCTVEYLERHTEPVDWTGGFMARFLTFYADRERTYTVPPGDAAARASLIDYLKHLNEDFVSRGQCLGFDAEARKFWDEWYISAINNNGAPEVQGAIARAPMHGLRVALLFAWDFGQVRSGKHWYITMRELAPAKAITNLHIESVQRVGEHLAPTRDMRERRVVLQAVKSHPRPLGKIVEDSKMLLRRVREILETLMEEGRIVLVAGKGQRYRLATEAERAPAPESEGSGPTAQIIQFPGNAGGSNASSLSAAASADGDTAGAAGASPQISTGGAPVATWGGSEAVATAPGADGRAIPVFSPPASTFVPIPGVSPTEPLTFGGFTAPDDEEDGLPPPPPGDPITF